LMLPLMLHCFSLPSTRNGIFGWLFSKKASLLDGWSQYIMCPLRQVDVIDQTIIVCPTSIIL
jgi:hypothetical protein